MSVLGRRPSWHTQIRQAKAKEWLLAGHLDNFPLAELQKIAAGFLRDSTPFLSRRTIRPKSQECDVLFANELATVRGELGLHESAILACMHLLSYPQARGQLLSIRPNEADQDLFFERRLDAYLQCIVLTRRAYSEVCSDEERAAAEELLGVLRGRSKDFPSIMGLLKAIGHAKCENVLPVPLVKRVLKMSHYQANLTRELESLRVSRQWFDAYKLVCGLREVIGLPKADGMLRDMFPDYPMWAAWRPDPKRILSWESPNLAPYRARLGLVLDLEGPDTTGQQRGNFRMSSPGAFADLSEPAYSHDRDILDHLLETLDACLATGPHTVDLLIALCIENCGLSRLSLEQLEAAVEVNDDEASRVLAALIRSLCPDVALTTRITSLAAALVILTRYPILQGPFGIPIGFPQLSVAALTSGQAHFSQCLTSGHSTDEIGLAVLRLGHAMRSAVWLHQWLDVSFLSMLHGLPMENEAMISLRAVSLHGPSSPSVSGHVGFLATRIGGSAPIAPRPDFAELPGSEPQPLPAKWEPTVSINRDRSAERHDDTVPAKDSIPVLVELSG